MSHWDTASFTPQARLARRCPCQGTCGPGDLQVESACMGVDVDHFTGEEEIGDQLAAHGAGLDLLYADAAAGDHRFVERPWCFDGQGQGFEHVQELFPLGAGYLIAGQGSVNSAKSGKNSLTVQSIIMIPIILISKALDL